MEPNQQSQLAAFQFKGGNLTVTTLEVLVSDCNFLEQELKLQIRKAPAFFQKTPVVLSFERLPEDESVALEMVVDLCKRNGLVPIAVRCSQDLIKQSAWALGLGWFPPQPDRRAKEVEEVQPCLKRLPPKLVRGTVRSGQQVYASCSDLVIVGSVNEGAEVIADGSIQVWGALRGRAIAGAQGDESSWVLCHQMKAELVSIAGVFRTFEASEWPENTGAAQELRLEDDSLILA